MLSNIHYYTCVQISEGFGAAIWELGTFKILTVSAQIMPLVVLGPLVPPFPPLGILYCCVFLGLRNVRYTEKKVCTEKVSR